MLQIILDALAAAGERGLTATELVKQHPEISKRDAAIHLIAVYRTGYVRYVKPQHGDGMEIRVALVTPQPSLVDVNDPAELEAHLRDSGDVPEPQPVAYAGAGEGGYILDGRLITNPMRELDKEQRRRLYDAIAAYPEWVERVMVATGGADAGVKLMRCGDGKFSLIHRSLRAPGRWQHTYCDEDGTPGGDEIYDTRLQAIRDVIKFWRRPFICEIAG